MTTTTITEHIEITPGVCGGRPRIAGRRIRVQDVAIWHERIGMSPDEIASEYNLMLGEVYAALAYYFDHREQIEADIQEGQRLAEELRAKTPSKLREKLHGRSDLLLP